MNFAHTVYVPGERVLAGALVRPARAGATFIARNKVIGRDSTISSSLYLGLHSRRGNPFRVHSRVVRGIRWRFNRENKVAPGALDGTADDLRDQALKGKLSCPLSPLLHLKIPNYVLMCC